MTKIVKSIAVVDDSPEKKKKQIPLPALSPGKPKIIKSRFVDLALREQAEKLPEQDPEELEQEDYTQYDAEEIRARAEEYTEEPAPAPREDPKAKAAAQELLAGAQQEAEAILAQAHAQAAQIAEEARNNGYLEGFSKGYEESAQEFRGENEPKAVMIADILDRLSDYEQELLESRAQNLVALAFSVAKKVIGDALQTDPTLIAEMLRGVVEQNSKEKYIKITLSPELMPVQARANEEVRRLLADMGAGVTVTTDSDLPEGGAMVETPKGIVDVSISTQLDNLQRAALSD